MRKRGARNVHVAPQAVDNSFWSAPVEIRPADPAWPDETKLKFMFVGRPDREKGIGALIRAWQRSDLQASSAALVLVGVGSSPPWIPPGGAVVPQRADTEARASLEAPPAAEAESDEAASDEAASDEATSTEATSKAPPAGVSCIAPVPAERLREMYADADVLVVPSIRTRTFREPWGLVINEAMNSRLAIIASDAVGAAAGGLVRDGHNGLVVAAGDVEGLAQAMVRLSADPELRKRLGDAGAIDVGAYTYDAWADGFSKALATVGLSRAHC